MAAPAKRGKNEPEPRPIIVKKIIAEGHGGHHGGAWKVAYADFVTAMMAFFLLMWILGATTEKQRKGIADYFTPTMIQLKQKTAYEILRSDWSSDVCSSDLAPRIQSSRKNAIIAVTKSA